MVRPADPDPELFRELQRLRARVAGLEVENQDLKERLAYAWSEVEHVLRPAPHAPAPGGRPSSGNWDNSCR